MRVDILDSSVFSALQPYEIERYLRVAGWTEVRREPNTVAVWENASARAPDRVWVPLNTHLSDYPIAIGKVIKAIADAEARSQLEIVDDLRTTLVGDVVRHTTWDERDRNSSSIPFEQGNMLIHRAYQMASAAAMATANARSRQAVYPNRPTDAVSEYLQKLRLGQTEQGSYRIKLISPIPSLEPTASGELPGFHEVEPFSRRVVVNLMRGLDALRRAGLETDRRGRFLIGQFRELVPEGVSANLCEAVAGDNAQSTELIPLEVNVSWASALQPPGSDVPQTVTFAKAILPYIAQAGEELRQEQPLTIRMRGFVVALLRDEFGLPGQIVIYGRADDNQRRVRLSLPPGEYTSAVEAHRDGIPVEVEGELTKRGQQYSLAHPTNFRWAGNADSAIGDQLEFGQ